MNKKITVRLTEQQLSNLISNSIFNTDKGDLLKNMLGQLLNKKKSSEVSTIGGLDLNSKDGYNAYKEICNKFIATRPSNLLDINGEMLASAAKKTLASTGKLVPPELALAQLAAEGGFSNNPNARPIRTKNPFNVGNVDMGKNVSHGSVESGIQAYYDLIARKYLSGGKTAEDLMKNFTNTSGQRYASGKDYEGMVSKIATQVKNISQPIYAALNKGDNSNLV
jgi:hypothetical protein